MTSMSVELITFNAKRMTSCICRLVAILMSKFLVHLSYFIGIAWKEYSIGTKILSISNILLPLNFAVSQYVVGNLRSVLLKKTSNALGVLVGREVEMLCSDD